MAKNKEKPNRKKQGSAKKKTENLASYKAQRVLDLEKVEDQLDLKEARAVLAEVKKNGSISWQAIKAELKL